MSKTISIDEEALARLEDVRKGDESWSDVIRRCITPRRTVDEIVKLLARSAPSEEVLDAAKASLTKRRATTRRRS